MYVYRGEWCSDWLAALWAYRRAGRIHPLARAEYHADKEAALARLAQIDEVQMWLAEERRALVGTLHELREQLYPPVIGFHPRRPPIPDEPPLPPTVASPLPLRGYDLRTVIRALMARHERLTLRELHRQIHLAGYEVDAANPVKVLADATRYELLRGRLVRVARGIYQSVMRRRPRAADPVVQADPHTWWDDPPTPGDPEMSLDAVDRYAGCSGPVGNGASFNGEAARFQTSSPDPPDRRL